MTIAEGRPEGVATLEAMPTVEFYYLLSAWQQRQAEIAKAYEKK